MSLLRLYIAYHWLQSYLPVNRYTHMAYTGWFGPIPTPIFTAEQACSQLCTACKLVTHSLIKEHAPHTAWATTTHPSSYAPANTKIPVRRTNRRGGTVNATWRQWNVLTLNIDSMADGYFLWLAYAGIRKLSPVEQLAEISVALGYSAWRIITCSKI